MKSTLKVKVRNIPVTCSRWTYLSYEGYSLFSQIDQSKHCEGSIGVLSQTAIAPLGETPEMLERQERMLNLGSQEVSKLLAVMHIARSHTGASGNAVRSACRTQSTEQGFHARQKCRLARCSAVNLKPFDCRQCYLLHCIVPCNQSYLSEYMTN